MTPLAEANPELLRQHRAIQEVRSRLQWAPPRRPVLRLVRPHVTARIVSAEPFGPAIPFRRAVAQTSREQFGPPCPTDAPVVVTLQAINRTVATYYGITIADLVSPDRRARFVRARQVAMYLSRRFTPYSYFQISRKLGNRDHTTILHGSLKIEGLLAGGDAQMMADVAALKHCLGVTDAHAFEAGRRIPGRPAVKDSLSRFPRDGGWISTLKTGLGADEVARLFRGGFIERRRCSPSRWVYQLTASGLAARGA